MNKYISTSLLIFITVFSFGQQRMPMQPDPMLNNWFANKPVPIMPMTDTPPPPPDVPLDGGLIALIAAGGAMGYKKYKDKNVE